MVSGAFWRTSVLLRIERYYSGTRISSYRFGKGIVGERCFAPKLSIGVTTDRTQTSHLQKQRRIYHPRATLFSAQSGRTRSGVDLYPWRSQPADGARLPLHVLLPQRLRRE